MAQKTLSETVAFTQVAVLKEKANVPKIINVTDISNESST